MKGYFLISCLAVGVLLSSCTSVQKICVQQHQSLYQQYKDVLADSNNLQHRFRGGNDFQSQDDGLCRQQMGGYRLERLAPY